MTGGGATGPHLTPRQTEVLRLVARGDTNKQIAVALGVSERAIKAHVSILLEKFSVHNRAALIARLLSAPPHGATSPTDEFARYDDAPFLVQVVHGLEMRFAYVNRRSAEVLGIARERFLGRTQRELFPDIRREYVEAQERAYREGRAWSFDNVPGHWRDDNGTEHEGFFDFVTQPLRDDSGEVFGLLLIGTQARTR